MPGAWAFHIEDPKPSREHYGTWLGNNKQPAFQKQIRRAIDAALDEKPEDFEELLHKLAQPSPQVAISGVWGRVTNKHLAGIPETEFLLNTQSYGRLHCLPICLFSFMH